MVSKTARQSASGKTLDKLFRMAYVCAYKLHLIWNFVFRPTHHGVWVAVWAENELLLIKNSYRDQITLPGGGCDGGESLPQAAVRELREEVGLQVAPQALSFWGQYVSRVEYKLDHINLFELFLEARPEIQLDQREVEWSTLSTLDAAMELNLFPALRNYLEDKRPHKTG